MKVRSATPVLFVDRIEPAQEFFVRAGFKVEFQVPDGDQPGFAMLDHHGVKLMLETRDNNNEPAELRALSKQSRGAVVYLQVDNLDALVAALAGDMVTVPRHKTFYGAEEITYEVPGGHVATFAK